MKGTFQVKGQVSGSAMTLRGFAVISARSDGCKILSEASWRCMSDMLHYKQLAEFILQPSKGECRNNRSKQVIAEPDTCPLTGSSRHKKEIAVIHKQASHSRARHLPLDRKRPTQKKELLLLSAVPGLS